MALSKKAKIWTIILSIPIVIIIGCVIALKIYLTSDRLKGMLVPQIEAATQRTVSIKEIGFSILPTFSITVEGLTLSNPHGTTFEHNEFISLDNLTIDLKLFPLLRSQVEINNIILDRLKVYLEISPEGIKNYSSGKKSDVNVSTQSGGKNSGALLLSNFEIRNCEIEYLDKKFDSRMLIGGLNLTARAEAPTLEGAIHAESNATIDKFSFGSLKTLYLADLPMTSSIKVSYDATKDILTFDDASAKLKDLPVTMSGTISALQKDDMMMDLTITTPQVQLTQLLSLIPPEMLKSASGLSSSGDVKFLLTVKGISNDVMSPGATGSFTVSNGTIKYASLPKSITDVNLAGSFEKPAAPKGAKGIGTFSLDKLSAKLGGNDIGGKLTMSNFDDPSLKASFTAAMNLSEVKDFYPLEQGTELKGMMNANISLDGKAKVPASMKANGIIEFKDVTIKTASSPRPLKNLNGTITFNNDVIGSKQLAMNIGESDMSLSFSMKNYLGMVMADAAKSGKPSATVVLVSKQLRTADLMSESAPPSGESKKNEQKQEGGLLPGFDIDANISIGKLSTEKFEFNNVQGGVYISQGIVTLKNLSMNAFDGKIATKGTLDLRDKKKRPFNLDLDINSVESNSMLSKFSSFGNNLFGKFTMKTKLQGDLNDTLGLDKQSLLGDGSVQLFDGKLLGFPLTSKLADATGVTSLREVNFKNWSNAFSISNGRININDLKVNAGTTDFLVGGSQGLDGSMDYNLNVKLPESVSGQLKLPGVASQLVQYFKDKDGRINLNFFVSGMATSPSLKLDTRAQEDMAKQAVDKKKNELLDEGKKKAEDALKKLFKRP